MISAARLLIAVAVVALITPAAPAGGQASGGRSCVGLSAPAGGIVSALFEPGPGYEGHWGIDYEGDPDGLVQAAAGGKVVFAGRVAHNPATVTIDHGGGLWTSYSYLEHLTVLAGEEVERGTVVGTAGHETGHGDVHFSVRIQGEYVDPLPLTGCVARAPAAGLRLLEVR